MSNVLCSFMFYTAIGCVEYFVSLYVVQTPWICRVFCVPLCCTYLLVCQMLCVPLCYTNPLSMSSVLCSFMLYKPLVYVLYFVFLYVVHTSYECWVFRISRCCTYSFGNSGGLHSSLTAPTTWIYRMVCFPTFRTYLLVLIRLVFWFHKLKKIQTNIFGS